LDCVVERGAPANGDGLIGTRGTMLSISATAAAFLPKLNSRNTVTPRTLGLNTGPAAARRRLETTVMKRSAAHFHVGI
jgi:hypothetical protein